MFEVIEETKNDFKILFAGSFSQCIEYIKNNNLILSWELFIR